MLSSPSLSQALQASAPTGRQLTIAVGIPTRGRPGILKETLADLALQTMQPAAILVAFWEAADIGDAPTAFPEVRFLQGSGSGGSCAQRNRLLEAAGGDFDRAVVDLQTDQRSCHAATRMGS